MHDHVRFYKMLAGYYLEDNKRNKALACLEKLLQINPAETEVYNTILKCSGIDVNGPFNEKTVEVLLAYKAKEKKVPNKPLSMLINLMPADHPQFKELLIEHLRPQVIKGVPSVINELKSFYKTDLAKAKILGSVMTEMCAAMEADMTLFAGDEEEQDPTVQLWLYYYVSQHYMRYAD